MRFYDYKKAKQFIEKNKESIKQASLGMHEDWFWTAETIFKDGKYLVDFNDTNLERSYEQCPRSIGIKRT